MRRKPAHCSKARGPRRAHREQLLAAAEGALVVAVRDDRLGERRPEPRDVREQRRRGGVEVDADRVHRVLDHRLQRPAEPVLVDVVLVLADADRLRLDLDQLGQRVLQPPRDRDGAAQRDVEVRETPSPPAPRPNRPRRRPRRRSPSSASAPGSSGQQLGDQPLGLAARRAVADGDELDPVAARSAPASAACAPRTSFLRLERIDRVGREQLAGRVDHRDLHARCGRPDRAPSSRAHPAGAASSRSLRLRAKTRIASSCARSRSVAHQVEHHRAARASPARPSAPTPSASGRRAASPGDAERCLDHRLDPRQAVAGSGPMSRVSTPSFAPRIIAERPVARHARPLLAMGEVVGELRALLLLALHHPRASRRPSRCRKAAQPAEQRGVLARAARSGCRGRRPAPPSRRAPRR